MSVPRLDVFITLYGQFLNFDAISSLEKTGRDRDHIHNYFKLFTAIYDPKADDTKFKSIAMLIAKKQTSYENDYKDLLLNIYKPVKNQIIVDRRIMNQISQASREFYIAYGLYVKHRHTLGLENLKTLYLKNVKDFYSKYFISKNKEKIIEALEKHLNLDELHTKAFLKQSLMEFNNALAHIYTAIFQNTKNPAGTYYSKKEISNGGAIKFVTYTNPNYKRALSHIRRGMLDFYKAILKDRMYVNKMTEEQKKKLKVIRRNEYIKIGKEENQRSDIFKKYTELINEILKEPAK